jgi:mono/diheme cytochrome c family protein
MSRALAHALCSAAALILVTACTTQAHEPTEQALARDGQEIAVAQCSGCHAVGEYGESPNPDAPPFRTVLSRYRSEVLKEELIAGIEVTHAMPEFQFNPQGVDALIAYMRSIQTEPAE